MTTPMRLEPARTAQPQRRPAVPPAPATPRPRHLRTVEAAPRRRLTPGLLATLVVTVVFGALFALAVFHTVVLQGQQRLDRLDQQVLDATADYQRSRLAVAQLESPERIVDAALAQGLVPADDVTYLNAERVIDSEGATVEPTAPPSAAVTEAADASGWASVKPFLGAE
ncbi:hypothetical protein BH20ACT2_BH20ACT2_23860 [soil metagenome]